MAFRLLVLVASDRSKAEILIAYPVCNIMEETSSVIVCSVNIGNLIITRREVLEACIISCCPVSAGLRRGLSQKMYLPGLVHIARQVA